MENRWGNSEKSIRLYFLGSKITADGEYSHEIKRRLLLGRKAMTNLDSILKSKDITLPRKVPLVKAMVFPNGHALEQSLGVSDDQGSLVCCSPWGCKKADTTEQLN